VEASDVRKIVEEWVSNMERWVEKLKEMGWVEVESWMPVTRKFDKVIVVALEDKSFRIEYQMGESWAVFDNISLLGREPYFYESDFLPLLGTVRIILDVKKPREHILIYPCREVVERE
jgi:hypothetical protein